MEGCGGKDEQSNLFKGNNDTDSIIVLISLQSKPTRSVDKVFECEIEFDIRYSTFDLNVGFSLIFDI